MKNNKGFTLVEILAVIVILAIVVIVTVPMVSNSGKDAKISVLKTKVENIKKAAIIFAQNKDNNVTFTNNACNACYDDSSDAMDMDNNNYIDNCFCYSSPIKVLDLIGKNLESDVDGKILNPVDESKNLNDCSITLYKKYGKVYAKYDAEGDVTNGECWYVE